MCSISAREFDEAITGITVECQCGYVSNDHRIGCKLPVDDEVFRGERHGDYDEGWAGDDSSRGINNICDRNKTLAARLTQSFGLE